MPITSSFPDENLVTQVSQPPPTNPSPPSPQQPGDTNHVPGLPPIPDSDRRALQRLVSGAMPQEQIASLIESIVSNVKATDIVQLVQEGDAQTFIDVMENVWVALFGVQRTGSLLILVPLGAE